MILVFVEHAAGVPDPLAEQALTFARGYAAEAGEPLHALATGPGAAGVAAALGRHGVAVVHVAEHEALDGSAPAALASALAQLAVRLSPVAVVAAGSDRGNELLARVGATLELPVAANCIAAAPEAGPADPAQVTRQRWGGSLLEEARLHAPVKLLTLAPHVVAAEPADATAATAVEAFAPELAAADLALRVVERGAGATAARGTSLADARVVVTGGRGVGSAEGFSVVEELAGLLGGAVGCSRAVTMAGWRPHTDQVGQTGTKIAPDIYIAAGISGATQHLAGCKGAKRILAVSDDPEAPIHATADYAVIGDLHEILPAISAEIRRVRGR